MLTGGSRRRSAGGDPYWANVALLLDPTGLANGTTSFTDLSSNAQTMTTFGNFEVQSGLFDMDGTGDYLTAGNDASLLPGTGDFFLEIKDVTVSASAASNDVIFALGDGAYSTDKFSLYANTTDNTVYFRYDSSGYLGFASFTDGVAFDVSVGRSGSTLYGFKDGVLLDSSITTFSNNLNTTADIFLGAGNSAGNFFGLAGALRYTVGVCRHTSSYTVPTSFPTP